MKILVLVSGNGTNLQALIDAEQRNLLGKGEIIGVVSDRADVFALERATRVGIPVFVEEPNRNLPKIKRRLELSNRILQRARAMNADLIVYAGFLSILSGELISVFASRMINIHPSLLPKFGGEGMFGDRVHAAVLAAGETDSGCTVHFVDAGVDAGTIILQRRVPILPGDTPETLAERIHKEEHIAIVEAVAKLAGV
ncbi:MAG: phosphoribosylglycinamide formyltransferase [Treponema sp.]|jgi:phosphoribosylglycinamide formyltransferase-1|nr:phosphoribosylglycinamide formyltransferase [Treponema sp.]